MGRLCCCCLKDANWQLCDNSLSRATRDYASKTKVQTHAESERERETDTRVKTHICSQSIQHRYHKANLQNIYKKCIYNFSTNFVGPQYVNGDKTYNEFVVKSSAANTPSYARACVCGPHCTPRRIINSFYMCDELEVKSGASTRTLL